MRWNHDKAITGANFEYHEDLLEKSPPEERKACTPRRTADDSRVFSHCKKGNEAIPVWHKVLDQCSDWQLLRSGREMTL